MPRPATNTMRKVLYLPTDLIAQYELLLFSEAEGRVPYKAWTYLVEPMLRRALDRQRIDVEAASRVADAESALEVAAVVLREEGYANLAEQLREAK